MSNFLQSPVRKHIKSEIYGDTIFDIELCGEQYFGIQKTKKIGPLSLSRFQVLGVQLPMNEQLIKHSIEKIKSQYHTPYTNIFFQLGITNIIDQFSSPLLKNDAFTQQLRAKRELLKSQLNNKYSLIPSFRENMPLATVIIDTNKSDEELLKYMNSGAQKHVRKAVSRELEFSIADPSEYDNFYTKREKISMLKGFNIIKKSTFQHLMNYLHNEQCGDIFVAHKDGILLGGSIAIYYEDTITYLYGFSNRDPRFHNIGVHHFIKYKMFSWAREHGYQFLDLLGAAPSGYPTHPLTGVSSFKESLGGDKIEYYGNYDIVLNPMLYRIMKWKYQHK